MVRINQHVWQPHKEPTPQLRSYWSTHSTHEKIRPTCNQIRNQNHTDETRHIEHNPHKMKIKKKNYADSKTLPASIKEKETHCPNC